MPLVVHCDVFIFFFLFVKYVLSLLPSLLCVFAVFALTWGTSVVFLFLLSSVRKRKQCECLRAWYFYSFCYLPTSRTKHSRKQTHLWTVQTTAQCTVLTALLLWARMVRMICLHTCSCDEVLVASRYYIVRAGALLLFLFADKAVVACILVFVFEMQEVGFRQKCRWQNFRYSMVCTD